MSSTLSQSGFEHRKHCSMPSLPFSFSRHCVFGNTLKAVTGLLRAKDCSRRANDSSNMALASLVSHGAIRTHFIFMQVGTPNAVQMLATRL